MAKNFCFNQIKFWLKELNFSINDASNALGISKRQIARLLSGATSAKRVHALAMQMLWLINENEKDLSKNVVHNKNTKSKTKVGHTSQVHS